MDEGSSTSLIPSELITEVGNQITGLKDSVTNLVSSNFENICYIVGAFVAIGLVFWLVKICKRAFAKG